MLKPARLPVSDVPRGARCAAMALFLMISGCPSPPRAEDPTPAPVADTARVVDTAGGPETAQVAPDEPLAPLAWMSTTWRGEFLGGPCEEIWSLPRDGAMMGVFRITTGRGSRLYELMLIERRGDETWLSFRHFKPGVEPIDPESIELKLVTVSETEAVFENPARERPARVRYARSGAAADEVTVEIYATMSDAQPQSFTMRQAR